MTGSEYALQARLQAKPERADEVAAVLMENADELLAAEPEIEEIDVLAAKHP